MKNCFKPILVLITLILISALAPVYFMADDWEHLNWYKQDLPPYNLIKEFYRAPAWYFLHNTIFPIFAEGHFFIGKLICYTFLLASSFMTCFIFIKDFSSKFIKTWSYFFLPFFMAFPINLFEWSYWPTNMVCFPALFFMLFGLWLHIEFPNKLSFILKNFFYLFGFYTYESLLPLAILLEVTYTLYFEEKSSDLMEKIISCTKKVLPLVLVALITKYWFDTMRPFNYPAKLGFKPHLFIQWLALTFSHDYYKVRHLTGLPFTISLITIIFYQLKTFKKNIQFHLLLMLGYLIGSSYYFIIMDYSARRALGGQIYFFWALISILTFNFLDHWKELDKFLKSSIIIFFTFSMIHHTYILTQKYKEKVAIEKNIEKLIILVNSHEDLADASLNIPQGFPRKGLERAWNFIGIRQLNGFIRTYLTKEQLRKINLKNDKFKEYVPESAF